LGGDAPPTPSLNSATVKEVNVQTTYTIRIRETLGDHWRGYFENLQLKTVGPAGNRSSELSGSLDELALHGVLTKLSDLNLHLLSVYAAEEVSASH